MRELALHVMDIVENGVAAGATLITVSVQENRTENFLYIQVSDNGRGIPVERLQKVMDPFFTTRKTRRVGLGLSMFRETCKRCDGEFELHSKEGMGTDVRASFRLDHIDRPPLGDMAGSLSSLIVGNPDVDFVYSHEVNGETFRLDTRQIREALDGISITHPKVIRYLADTIRESLRELSGNLPNLGSPQKKQTPRSGNRRMILSKRVTR